LTEAPGELRILRRRVSPKAINKGSDGANDCRGASIGVIQCEHSLKQRKAIMTREIRGLAGGEDRISKAVAEERMDAIRRGHGLCS